MNKLIAAKILFTLIFVSLVSVGNSVEAKENVPSIARSQLVGFSMYPTIKSGEYVVYKRTTVTNLKAGDIIVFEDLSSGQPVCHRIASIEDGKVKTKGDNNRFRDRGFITDRNLLGKVTFIAGRKV